ncbi:hypothetical protein V3C99_008944, partial [Haemonchus contortus]
MINAQSSLDDLNEKLRDKVTIEQFRPVIVVNNCDAFDENKWYSVHIGDVALQCTKPFERCVMTTINSATGMKHPSLKPLKTLRKYRLAPRDQCENYLKIALFLALMLALLHQVTSTLDKLFTFGTNVPTRKQACSTDC